MPALVVRDCLNPCAWVWRVAPAPVWCALLVCAVWLPVAAQSDRSGPAAAGPGSSSPATSSSAASSSPALAQRSAEPAPQFAPGVTQSLRDVKLSLTASGRIEALRVREGQRVKPGQLLLHLDRSLEELEVQRRRLLLADTSRLVELASREKTLTEQLASIEPLLRAGAISRKQYEDESMALNNVISERKALEVAKRREQVELKLAIESFERRHLRSPIAGVVTKISQREGESVAANEPVVQVVDVSRVRFLSTVAAAVGGKLQTGQSVRIQLGAFDKGLSDKGQVRQGRIVFVSPVTDAASGLVEVIAEFDNQDGSVKPGVSGRMLF
jgi:RND family efflux transporter MFP subunit